MENISKDYQISIYLDIRRAKNNGKFPVKLRVFTSHPRMQKLYPTKFEFTEDEFDLIWNVKTPRGDKKKIKTILQGVETLANEVADSLDEFDFEEFEKLIAPNQVQARRTVNEYFKLAIENLRRNNKLTTATGYEYSLKSFLDFHKKNTLYFKTITTQWLKDYEADMLQNGKSKTTVGMYARNLRAIFNTAIAEGVIKQDKYPFGKGKYVIPNPKTVKATIDKENLSILLNGQPQTPDQEKAKAFWFFSFACNGMNIKDIAYLRYKFLINDETFYFSRQKIIDTNAEAQPVIIYLNDYTKGVISKYGNKKINNETLIFSIISDGMTQEEKDRAVSNFNRYINQHIKKYAKSLKLDIKINPKIARHSFATNLIRNGGGMELAQEFLGHSNMKTTQNYFAGFADNQKRAIANKIMDFE